MAEAKTFILVVEDEPGIAEILTDYLKSAGYAAESVGDGAAALPAIDRLQPDLVLLDIMLPNMDGLEICRQTRRISDVPIIMLTAKVEEIDRLIGLELGADDYICKPFSPREVVARVKAVLRRPRLFAPAADTGPLELDDDALSAKVDGKRLDLTPTEYRLLKVLASRPGRVYSRAQLIDLVHDMDHEVYDRVIDTHIKNLRRKLSAALPGEELIHAVYGVGYRFEAG
jgi:two-component system response regulator BaeR